MFVGCRTGSYKRLKDKALSETKVVPLWTLQEMNHNYARNNMIPGGFSKSFDIVFETIFNEHMKSMCPQSVGVLVQPWFQHGVVVAATIREAPRETSSGLQA